MKPGPTRCKGKGASLLAIVGLVTVDARSLPGSLLDNSFIEAPHHTYKLVIAAIIHGCMTSSPWWRTNFIVLLGQLPISPHDQQVCADARHREVLPQRGQQGPAFPCRRAYRSPTQSDLLP